jgi:hypothetical protein
MPKNPTIEEISRKLGEIETGATNVQRALSDFKVQELPGGTTANQKATSDITGDATRTLTATLGGLDFGEEKKTIMERFAERERLAKEAETAGRGLVESRFAGEIEEAGEVGRRQITSAREAARSLGPASSGALIKIEEEKVNKKIKGLERQRDELLAQGRFDLASRLDDLMVSEQEALTTARQNYLTNFFNVSRELRERAAFETPEETRKREFELTKEENERQQVIDLATKAPSAGILSTDTLEQAISKFKNSNEYKMDIRGGELAISQAESTIALTKAETRKITSELEAESSPTIKSIISDLPVGQQEGAWGSIGSIKTMRDISELLDKGETNIAEGIVRKFGRPLGLTTAQENLFKTTITTLTTSFIKAVSGVQVSDRERKFLMGTLPSEFKTTAENRAGLQSMRNWLKNKYEPQLGVRFEDFPEDFPELTVDILEEGKLGAGRDLSDNLFFQLYSQ